MRQVPTKYRLEQQHPDQQGVTGTIIMAKERIKDLMQWLLLPTLEICGSNPVNGKSYLLLTVLEKKDLQAVDHGGISIQWHLYVDVNLDGV